MKTVKLASTKYYDELPTEGNELGQAFRDVELEQKILKQAFASGYGAQFGGKYFAHDIRIVRLSRHVRQPTFSPVRCFRVYNPAQEDG